MLRTCELRNTLLVFAILVFFGTGSAQINDAGLWTGATIEIRPGQTDAFHVSFSEELRFNENISELGTFFTEAGASYRLSSNVRISVHYRFINRRRLDDSYSKRHRYGLDISYRKKINRFTPVLRFRFQSQYRDMFSSDEGKIPEWYWRTKFSLRYNLRGPWNPYLATEVYYHFGGKQYDNVRYILGAERNISEKLQADFAFMHQREFNVRTPVYDYLWIIGLTYSI